MEGTASLWEVELMETALRSNSDIVTLKGTASLWEVELMETRISKAD